MKIYLVGGAIRDKLLGIESKDNDYVVTGSTPEEMIAAGFKQVGADFPVFLHPETGDEYALARTEKKTGVGYNGFTCEFSPDVTITEDLYRRDLTINSIAYDQDHDMYIDPYGGRYDIYHKIIRSTNPRAFADDPVRVLRAARFSARYNFAIEYVTLESMRKCVENEFDNLTPERVWKEFEKGLQEGSFYDMLYCLDLSNAFIGKLKPFYCNPSFRQPMKVASDIGASSEVVFALVSSHFTKADFIKWKIPNTYSELSLMNSSLDFSINEKSDVADILKFVETTGATKSSKRFQDALDLIYILMPDFYRTCLTCVDKIKGIDNVKVIGDEKNGVKIKELIHQEKLRLIAEVLL